MDRRPALIFGPEGRRKVKALRELHVLMNFPRGFDSRQCQKFGPFLRVFLARHPSSVNLVLRLWQIKSLKRLICMSIPQLVSKTVAICRKFRKQPPDFQRPKSSRRIYSLADLESVELTGGTHGVRSHIVKAQPIADAQGGRQLRRGANTVNGVARRTPHAAAGKGLRISDVEGATH